MKKEILGLSTIAALGLLLSSTASAALIDRGNGMIYDDVLDITWLQDANYAKTSGYDADGRMSWDDAVAWADTLVFGGYDDWRLASITDTDNLGCDYAPAGTDCGYNVDTGHSELAYMYHVNLGLKSQDNEDGFINPDWGIFGNGTKNGTDDGSWGENDIGLIKNLQTFGYWSATEHALYASVAWVYSTYDGYQTSDDKASEFSVWAVRSGDVGAAPVKSMGSRPD